MPAKIVKRSNLPFEDEGKYSQTQKQVTDRAMQIDTHAFLEYCRLRGQVAQAIRCEIKTEPALAVIGFLTGSVGLLSSARPYIESVPGARLAYVRGLSHTGVGEKKDVTESEFFLVLEESVKSGIRRIVLVDEIVSGGQMRSALKSTARWQKAHPDSALTVSVIGCYDDGIKPSGSELVEELRSCARWGDLTLGTTHTFCAPLLLEKDGEGLAFRSVKRGPEPGCYDFERERPASLSIVCPGSGEPIVTPSASSVDQVFGNHVAAVLGQIQGTLYSHVTQRITSGRCETCQSLLTIARQLCLPAV